MPSKGSWDRTEEAMENQGGGTFLRLEGDGDKAVVAFCGAPFTRDLGWNEKTKSYEPWDDAAKAAGRRRSTRYSMNAFVASFKGKPVNEMRVFDMNFATMTTVIGLRDKYGVGKWLYEVTRHGAANDTKTTYQILPHEEITAALSALFGTPVPNDRNGWNEGTVPLIDLEEATAKDTGGADAAVADDVKKRETKPKETKPAAAATSTPAAAPANGTTGHASPAPAANGTAPASAAASAPLISKEAVAVIIERLKPLDKEKGILLFMQKFPYARKISELYASDEAAGVLLANQLSAPAAPEDAFG
jgi:hypothetical protein